MQNTAKELHSYFVEEIDKAGSLDEELAKLMFQYKT